jgi:hypothetical protein
VGVPGIILARWTALVNDITVITIIDNCCNYGNITNQDEKTWKQAKTGKSEDKPNNRLGGTISLWMYCGR